MDINRHTHVIITTNVILMRVMSEIPKISEAEWEVMKTFWSKAVPCTANEIFDALGSFSDWKPNTVKTLVTRLVKKGALGFRERRVYWYYPLIIESKCFQYYWQPTAGSNQR